MSRFIEYEPEPETPDEAADECSRRMFVNISQIASASYTCAGPDSHIMVIDLIDDETTITIFNYDAERAMEILRQPQIVDYEEMREHLHFKKLDAAAQQVRDEIEMEADDD